MSLEDGEIVRDMIRRIETERDLLLEDASDPELYEFLDTQLSRHIDRLWKLYRAEMSDEYKIDIMRRPVPA